MTTRLMADATHDNVHALAGLPLDLVAGYVTGSPDVRWQTPDWTLFPGIPHVTIDQGWTGSPVPSAVVRDFEQFAWTASWANEHIGNGLWTPARPTVYSAQDTLQGILDDGWRRDLWVALPGWQPGHLWPPVVAEAVQLGCTIVAVQNAQDVAGAYDRSVVLDPHWPGVSPIQPPTWTEELVQQLPTLREGSTGYHVRTVQFECGQHGHPTTIDGIYGPNTSSAVAAVQHHHGLAADGIVGPQTWPVLLGVA